MEDHELVTMTQQYTQTHSGAFVCHEAYEKINSQVKQGRAWYKCPNCGNPYPIDKEGATTSICSENCALAYTDYLNGNDY